MCVICIKPENVKMPPKERLESMFAANADGCGFMFSRKGKVIIRKGFMKLKHFEKALKQEKVTDKDVLIMHFRIATAGSINPKNTHPFPISDNMNELRALRTEAELGLAHNGILSLEHDKHHDLSDTMTFIRDVLAEPTVIKNLFNPAVWYLIEETIGSSKMVILDKENKFHLLGEWSKDGVTKDGCYYSNLNFKWRENSKKDGKETNFYVYRGGDYYANRNNQYRDEERWRGVDRNAQDADFTSGTVEVGYDETNCPACGYTIASPRQICCTKCGIILYRLHDEVIN
jgi:predicted glutamine amidotransferase